MKTFDPSHATPTAAQMAAIAPGLFVLLWSTGFIGARLGLPYAEPFIFLAYRLVIVAVLMGALCLAVGAKWPRTPMTYVHIGIVGVLMQAAYLGGIFWAISQGLEAAVAALIVGLQPILTAIAAGPFLGETVSKRQWTGFALGFVAVVAVVSDGISFGDDMMAGVGACIVALLAITSGTLYQKRHAGNIDMRVSATIQFAAAAVPMTIFALVFERGVITWTGEFIFAMTWLVVVLSVGAISLLAFLIRQGATTKVASLFYLVPPVVAVEAYLLFDETLTASDLIGMALAMFAVFLVTHAPAKTKRS